MTSIARHGINSNRVLCGILQFGLTLALSTCGIARSQLADPIPGPVVASGTVVKLLDIAQIPDSGPQPAAARINMLKDANDGSGRLFVNDQRGTLYVIDQAVVSVYLDLAALHPAFIDTPGLGTGFHGFEFHPAFAANGLFYTVHTETPDAGVPDLGSPATTSPAVHSVVTEWTANNNTAPVFAGTSREILRIEQPSFFHSLQEIAFNPTVSDGDADFGLLYLGQGDGAMLGSGNGQGLDSPHGAMLRIDPAGNNSANGAYGIPADNPFADDGDPATLGEIWAWGFRNPHRFSWDSAGDNLMLIADIGQNNIEEINIGVGTANYGWCQREGTFVFDPATPGEVYSLPADDTQYGYSYPAAQYDHDEGNAVVGGFVYRGASVPELDGQYIFGDIVTGRLFQVAVDLLSPGAAILPFELGLLDDAGTPTTLAELTPGSRVDLKFGLDSDGEVYVLTKSDGMVRRIVTAAPTDSDQDGIADNMDNCTLLANSEQRDTDADGFGNRCDPDFNADCAVNFSDLALMKDVFFSAADPDTDLDGDGLTNFADLSVVKAFFFGQPGPSAQAVCEP